MPILLGAVLGIGILFGNGMALIADHEIAKNKEFEKKVQILEKKLKAEKGVADVRDVEQ